MKNRFLIFILSLLTIAISKADFLDEMLKIDKLNSEQNYEQAINLANQLLLTDITDIQRNTLNNEIENIKSKMNEIPSIESNIENDNNVDLIVENTMMIEKFGIDKPTSDNNKFKQYKEYEKEVLSRNDPRAITSLANLYFKDGLYEKAINIAKKDVTNSNENLYIVAVLSRMIGKYDESIEYYQKILSNNPNHQESLKGIGIAYKNKGDYTNALFYLKQYNNQNAEVEREIGVLEVIN